jgi:hypothetical protein
MVVLHGDVDFDRALETFIAAVVHVNINYSSDIVDLSTGDVHH